MICGSVVNTGAVVSFITVTSTVELVVTFVSSDDSTLFEHNTNVVVKIINKKNEYIFSLKFTLFILTNFSTKCACNVLRTVFFYLDF